MAAPELKKVKASLAISTAYGSDLKYGFESGLKGVPKPATPNQTLIAIAREVARIAEIAGCGEEVDSVVSEARVAVQEDRKKGIIS